MYKVVISTRSMIGTGAVLWLGLAAALPAGQAFGPAMVIFIDRRNNRLQGAADPRSTDGSAAGY